jgi:hypothetical protein
MVGLGGGPAVLLALSAQPTTQSPNIKQQVASLIWLNIPLSSGTRHGAKM